jgi:hypothetical protein
MISRINHMLINRKIIISSGAGKRREKAYARSGSPADHHRAYEAV